MLLARRRMLKMTVGLAGIGISSTAGCESPTPALHPEDFGATGNGNDTIAIQRLADEAARAGRLVDGRGRTYTVDNVDWPSGTYLFNIRLQLNPGDQDNRSPIAIGRRGTLTRNLIFQNVTVDGNRHAQVGVGRSGYADGALSGFQIRGAVENVTLRDCSAVNCATDGVMIFTDLQHGADDSYILRNIELRNVSCVGNRRHGLSADGFRGLRIIGCRFSDNGRDLVPDAPRDHGRAGARYNGGLYGRPFDIEDYLVGTGWADLLIEDTDCRQNVTGALIYSQVSPESLGFIARRNVSIVRCQFDELGGSRWDPPLGIAQSTEYRGERHTYQNIHLSDNIFNDGPLRVSGVEGFTIRGGRVVVSKKNETEPVIVSNCRKVNIDL